MSRELKRWCYRCREAKVLRKRGTPHKSRRWPHHWKQDLVCKTCDALVVVDANPVDVRVMMANIQRQEEQAQIRKAEADAGH